MEQVAYIFPGQGAQYEGMGKELYDAFPEVRKVFAHADEILQFPLTKYCFEGPAETLKNTAICQPAILLVSIACLEALNLKLNAIRSTLSAIFYLTIFWIQV